MAELYGPGRLYGDLIDHGSCESSGLTEDFRAAHRRASAMRSSDSEMGTSPNLYFSKPSCVERLRVGFTTRRRQMYGF